MLEDGLPIEDPHSDAAAEAAANFSASLSAFLTSFEDLRSTRRWAVISSDVSSARHPRQPHPPQNALKRLTLLPPLRLGQHVLHPPLPARFTPTQRSLAKEPSPPQHDHILLPMHPHTLRELVIDGLDLRRREGESGDGGEKGGEEGGGGWG